ncbi:hypothetical protein PGTUg99_003902 [Puccinia graminis f. sp. tritici]|uniref:Uncharacterized protein n=1 Tax=Puccinia graminis f. sp. tritici TaxID=56615 RepID=A0A5B0NG95_PUCGR|nr:hypothetical protein PGTUg99_003902 [Puccinia graminis f. sp. tritici]
MLHTQPKVKATRPNAKKKPTAEDFRTTHHDAMDIDPQLTKNGPADDEPEPSKEVTKRQDQTEPPKGVTKSPDENDPKKPLSPKKTTPKKKKTQGKKVIQRKNMYTTSDSEERTGPFHSSELEEGKWYDKHLPMANPNKEESMEEEEDTGVQEMWENGFIAVANGEWMNKQQFNSAIQDYPDLMFNRDIPIQFGRMANQMKTQPAHTQIQRAVSGLSRPKPPAHARADRSSEPQLASSIQPESTGIPKPQETQETKDPLNDVEPPAKIYPESLAHVTPHPSRKLSRMPSTTTTIGAALGIPSLAKASLEEMKDMHSIWSRTRDHLCKSMEELRIGGHHIKTPSAYDNLASHNSLVDIFCRRLQGRIQDAEKSGISKEIEVVDLIDLTGDDNDYPNSCLGERRLKRASRLSDIEDEDESPVQTKRARKSCMSSYNIHQMTELNQTDIHANVIAQTQPNRLSCRSLHPMTDHPRSLPPSHPKTTTNLKQLAIRRPPKSLSCIKTRGQKPDRNHLDL